MKEKNRMGGKTEKTAKSKLGLQWRAPFSDTCVDIGKESQDGSTS